jgi:ParB family chromosome partitioning protein
MATATKPRISLGGLKPLLKLDELDRDDDQVAPRSEEAPRMSLDLIDEDPNQPRQVYDPEKLQELADSIKAEGDVLQPVSLRPNPEAPGRYILNFGHRRCRAARIAGLVDVPYFVARKISSFTQVIENEQRENLTPMELALFIRDRMAEGMRQQEIAHGLGKSKTYVSKAAALIDAPAVVVEACSSGKVTGVDEAYELRNLHRDNPHAAEQLITQHQEIPRSAILAVRRQIEAPVAVEHEATQAPLKLVAPTPTPTPVATKAEVGAPTAAVPAAKPAARVVMGEYKGQPLVLDFSAEPPRDGHVFGRRPGSTRRLTVPAEDVRLVGFADE